MEICCIYRIVNKINNKCYVGKSRDFKSRKHSHESGLSKDKHPNRYLQNAWNKYGSENFEFEILEVLDNQIFEKDIKQKETDYIESFSSLYSNNGYNLTIDGEGHRLPKSVYQYDILGSFIKQFNSLSEAIRSLEKKRNCVGHISKSIDKTNKSAFGYLWRSEYLGDKIEPKISIERKEYKTRKKKVSNIQIKKYKTMTKEQLKKEILSKKSLLKKGAGWLSEKYDIPESDVKKVLTSLKLEAKEYRSKISAKVTSKKIVEKFYDKILEKNPKIVIDSEIPKPKPLTRKVLTNADPNNVLFIGDLHAPFILDGYLEFNMDLQRKYNCGTVIFAGDIIEGNAWSYHEHNADGLSVRNELDAAISQLSNWYKAFPNAIVLFGNHDLLISRKAKSYGLSQIFLRHFGDIVEAPKTWNFMHEYYKDNVLYIHGSQGNAINRATSMRHSVAQGHLHSEAFVQWSVSEVDSIFGLQVGCGIDRKAYAFEYANCMTKKPIISSGVVLDNGHLPILELMKL